MSNHGPCAWGEDGGTASGGGRSFTTRAHRGKTETPSLSLAIFICTKKVKAAATTHIVPEYSCILCLRERESSREIPNQRNRSFCCSTILKVLFSSSGQEISLFLCDNSCPIESFFVLSVCVGCMYGGWSL